MGARFAEFTGWLNQDSGDLRAAMAWSDRALDMAREAHNPAMTSYVLMRKSHIALDAGRPDLVLTLAQAALEVPGELTPRMRALAARQEAHAHAMFGDHDACARALDRAFELAAEPADEKDIARYCTPNYIEMEAAHAWVELGRPAMALDVLQQSLVEWKPDFRRDLGMGLARFAIAHARTGAPDDALDIALEAIQLSATPDQPEQPNSYSEPHPSSTKPEPAASEQTCGTLSRPPCVSGANCTICSSTLRTITSRSSTESWRTPARRGPNHANGWVS